MLRSRKAQQLDSSCPCPSPERKVRRNEGSSGRWVTLYVVAFCSSFLLQYVNTKSTIGLVQGEIEKMNRVVCQYDGECPTMTTCSASGNGRGFCEAIKPSKARSKSRFQECIESCYHELVYDEHYYHSSYPRILKNESVASEGRPLGCTIEFDRQPDRPELFPVQKERIPREWSPSMQEWNRTRFRYIQRVETTKDGKARAFCFAPCRMDTDCLTHTLSSPSPFTCADHVCQRNQGYWNDASSEELVIVTGANQKYFRGLQNLVGSIQQFAPNNRIVVYNLGMDQHQLKEIRQWPHVQLEWQDGIPSNLPEHFHQLHNYAWKPYIVEEAVRTHGTIFWLDAGNTLTSTLSQVMSIVQREGAFVVKGQDSGMDKAQEGTFAWFGRNKTNVGPHYSGNTQAWMYPSRYYDRVLKPNQECALDVNCIAPKGSSLLNHRYDQTSLSILLYAMHAPHYTEYLAANGNQLERNITIPSNRIVWTSRQRMQRFASLLH